MGDPTLASIDKESFKMTGKKPGETLLTVTGITKEGLVISKTAKITITPVLVNKIDIWPNPLSINKGETRQLEYEVGPDNATNKELTWESLNPDLVVVDDKGVVKGVGTGTGIIVVSSKDGNFSKEVTVNVGQPLIGINVPKEVKIEKGKSDSIWNYYKPVPTDATNVSSVTYTIEDDYYVSLHSDGVFTGNRLGSEYIHITVTDDKGTKYTAALKVIVTSPGSNERGDSKY
mgnify:FL=1